MLPSFLPIRSFEKFLLATQPQYYEEDTSKIISPGDPLGRDFDQEAMDTEEKRKHWKATNIKRRQLHPKVRVINIKLIGIFYRPQNSSERYGGLKINIWFR